jgi:hypothetical protein
LGADFAAKLRKRRKFSSLFHFRCAGTAKRAQRFNVTAPEMSRQAGTWPCRSQSVM